MGGIVARNLLSGGIPLPGYRPKKKWVHYTTSCKNTV